MNTGRARGRNSPGGESACCRGNVNDARRNVIAAVNPSLVAVVTCAPRRTAVVVTVHTVLCIGTYHLPVLLYLLLYNIIFTFSISPFPWRRIIIIIKYYQYRTYLTFQLKPGQDIFAVLLKWMNFQIDDPTTIFYYVNSTGQKRDDQISNY